MEAPLTKRALMEMMKDLSDDAPVYYHSYDHGLCLNAYRVSDAWLFPKGEQARNLVLNPGNDWDPRQSADRA